MSGSQWKNEKLDRVISGLEHHSGIAEWGCWNDNDDSSNNGSVMPSEYCPYFDEDNCGAALITEAINLLKEYDIALRMMVYQYCVDSYESAVDIPERFNHSFMSAGETAFKVLGIENKQEVPEDFVWG